MPLEYVRNEAGHFVCQFCDQIKKNQNTMHYHLKKHEGTLGYECNLCKKQFLHKNSLELHKTAKHTNERKDSIECPTEGCEFKALTKANMMIHNMRIHNKDKCIAVLEKKEGNISCCKKCKKDYSSDTAFYYHAYKCLAITTT
jgi:hypothetical protein